MTQPDPSAPRAQQSKRRRGGRGRAPAPAPSKPPRALAVTAVALAAVAAAASGYLIYTSEIGPRLAGGGVEARLAAVERRLAEGESAAGADQLSTRLAQVEESAAGAVAAAAAVEAQLHTVRGEIGALQAAAREREQAALREIHGLADAVAALQIDAARSRSADAWRLAEVEHLLVIANQRLQLGREVGPARRALALADDMLRQLADPGLAMARALIAEEIAALDQAAQVDVAGVLHQLAALARQAMALPLAGDALAGIAPAPQTVADAAAVAAPAADSDSGDGGIWAASKNLLADLGGLVQVETIDAAPPALPAETRALIRANAALLVESAGLAFLRAERAVYAARMAAAAAWVGAHFDAGAAATRDWRARLAALAAVPAAAELPDISRSLRAVRAAAGR